jgi:IMP dehydrogenase|tara:strand:- start:1102 stop:2127 length:1026 start_codon:yes stop_codon:yes gene_type:complete
MKNGLCFDDVLLEPRYSDIQTRSEIDLSSFLQQGDEGLLFKLPIISSPMDTITELDMATALGDCGGLGVVHRYNTISEQSKIVREVSRYDGFTPIGAAIGVTNDYYERAKSLVDAGIKVLCLDVAHGHHVMVRKALKKLRNEFNSVHIMAGNVATLEAFNDLADWGADSIRCGIGGGSICTTRIQTGHGKPTLQTIIDCAQSDRDAKLIADGGIKNSGDIVKALAAGADFVILGSLLAGTDEAPGETVYIKGIKHKTYRGMASKEAQFDWRKKTSSLEGVSSIIPYKGSVINILEDLDKGIRSGLSYSGARTLKEFRQKAVLTTQSPASQIESSAHIRLIR